MSSGVPLGSQRRSGPLACSLLPRCQGLWGSQKQTLMPGAASMSAQRASSRPWTQVRLRTSPAGWRPSAAATASPTLGAVYPFRSGHDQGRARRGSLRRSGWPARRSGRRPSGPLRCGPGRRRAAHSAGDGPRADRPVQRGGCAACDSAAAAGPSTCRRRARSRCTRPDRSSLRILAVPPRRDQR